MKIDGRTLDHKTLEHLRIAACKRVLEDGELPSVVAASLGFCRTSIYPWLRRIEEEGWEALAEKIAAGPDCSLTEAQRQRVKRWIVGRDPRQYGFEFGLWTRRLVQTMIQEKMDVELCLTSVGKLLAQLELTPQKPLRRAYERDPLRIERWKAEEFPKLKHRARKHGAKIYFLDETGFSSEPNLRRTYGLKGETPVVKTSGQRQKVNVISAVSMQGAFWCQIYTHTLKQWEFITFLKPKLSDSCRPNVHLRIKEESASALLVECWSERPNCLTRTLFWALNAATRIKNTVLVHTPPVAITDRWVSR
jgi:transposase